MQILAMRSSTYNLPSLATDLQLAEIEVWQRLFPEPYELVAKALTQHILTNTYPPSPAHLKEIIYDMVAPKGMSAEEAFVLLRESYRRIGWGKQMYEELPQEIKDVYTYAEIEEIKQMQTDYINNFERNNFIKRYKEKQNLKKTQLITSGKSLEIAVQENKLLEDKSNG